MHPRILAIIGIVILTGVMFAIDLGAGKELNLWILYVLPIAAATVTLGYRAGLVVVAVASVLLFAAGYLLGNPFSSTLIFVIDRLSCVVAYVLFASTFSVAARYFMSPNGRARFGLNELGIDDHTDNCEKNQSKNSQKNFLIHWYNLPLWSHN